MNAKLLLPFLLAPFIGGLIAMQLSGEPEPAADGRTSHATAADRATGGSSAPDEETGGAGFSFADVMSIMRTGGDGSTASELKSLFDAALQQPPGEDRMQALQRAFTRWMLEAPGDALAHVQDIPPEERRAVVTAALAVLAERRPASFEKHSAGLAHEQADLAMVIAAVAERNPGEAIEWLRQYGTLDAHAELVAAALPGLIRSDIALAAGAVADMQDRAPLALIQQVAAAYARHDPAQAYQWASQMIDKRPQAPAAQLLDEISSSLAAGDQDAAAQFMSRTVDPGIRKSLMSELAIRKGQDDLASAWNWLHQYNGDPSHAEAAQKLLYRWSYTKPQDVAQILPTIADAALQAGAAAHLSRFWQQKDPAAHQGWVASLPPGPLRSAVLASR